MPLAPSSHQRKYSRINIKQCSKCGVEYPATAEFFYSNKNGLYGLRSDCKACRREHKRQYYAENAEKVLAYNRQWLAKNPDKKREYSHRWYVNNKGKHHESGRKWAARNREKVRAASRRYRACNPEKSRTSKHTWVSNNLDKMRASRQRWDDKNPNALLIKGQRRRARVHGLLDTLTTAQWQLALNYWKRRCAYCGAVGKLTIDHYIPVNNPNCPGTVAANVVPACSVCNSSKGDNNACAWMRWKFGEEKAREIQTRIQTYFYSV